MSTVEPSVFPAVVVAVVDQYKVAINRGATHGVKVGQRFLIYGISKETLRDPRSGEDLGKLEVPRGTGRVVHVQDKMAMIESDRRERGEIRIIRRHPLFGGESEEQRIETAPFDDASVGDEAKPI